MTALVFKKISKKIFPIFRRHDVVKAALFGSFARGDDRKNSDVDILVKFGGRKSLMDVVRLQFALEEKIGKKVDLLTYDSIHPLLKDIILKEQKTIYEKKL